MDQIKKIIKKYFFFSVSIFFIFFFFSCNNESINLGGFFEYDKEHKYISSNQSGILYPIINRQSKRKDIPPRVINYVYNKKYILVKQKPKFPLEQIYYDHSNIKYSLGIDTIYYWIIDKKNGVVDGPLLYNEFYYKCNVLQIDNNLMSVLNE